MTNFF
jgi:hypothetical protein